MRGRITGTGSFVPDWRVTNEDLTAFVETSDAWIRERTGIRERRVARAETTVSMAAEAGRRALANAGLQPEAVELLLVATLSPDDYFPSTACRVQAELGLVNAVAFDVNAACSGFLFALHTADAYLRSGFCRTALIIGSEIMSRMVDWRDRSTCILFGDGAGAAVVQADEREGIIEHILGSDGARGQVLTCKNRGNSGPCADGYQMENKEPPDRMHMDGQAVFRFAVKTVPLCIEQLLEKAGVKKEEISLYLLHQANSRIIQSVSRRLQEPEEKFPMNLAYYGNTSAASLGILLDELNRAGRLKAGEKLVLSGFGAGLTWGAVLLTW